MEAECITVNNLFGGITGPQPGKAGFFIFDFISAGYEILTGDLLNLKILNT